MFVLPFLTLAPEPQAWGRKSTLSWCGGVHQVYIAGPPPESFNKHSSGPDLTQRDCTQEGCPLRLGQGVGLPSLLGTPEVSQMSQQLIHLKPEQS